MATKNSNLSAQRRVELKLAAESTKNIGKGGKNARLSLIKQVEVEFIKDGKFIKAGTTKMVSEKAALIYVEKGIAKKV